MIDEHMTPEEGQLMMNKWFESLPAEIEKLHLFITENVKKFHTFNLLSYFSYYNQLHSTKAYSDDRGDKHFFVSEVIALLCLKNDFIEESVVSEDDYMVLIKELQESILSYCGRSDALVSKPMSMGEDVVSDAADLLSREAKQIRNPGLPDHHLIFTEILFEPVKEEIKKLFGFSVADSVIIRELLPSMINEKCKIAIEKAISESNSCAKEIENYKKRKVIKSYGVFSKEELEKYSLLGHKEISQGLKGHFLNKMFYNFGEIFTFTSEELANYTGIELVSVEAFLKTFSCGFPSLKEDDRIYEPITLLKSKPLLEHKGQYLLPSFPLLTWAVEDLFFDEFFSNKKKLVKSISDIRHDFILNEGLGYFKQILPTAIIYPPNLNYYFNGKKFETDGLIVYDKTLFVIEAKGHRITSRAKTGDKVRTQKHLKQIIEDSYSQGIRTIDYIEQSEKAEFKPSGGGTVEINKVDIDNIIVVCLTFEPIGNLSMLIKGTNELGYFKASHFPLILSIYDLAVFADIFDNPIVFMHYIKRRKMFLSNKIISIYEELDLVSYFLYNGLSIDNTLKDVKENSVNWVHFSPDTDAINDYYMYKFGHKEKLTLKPKFYISKEFNKFLIQLDTSRMQYRVRMGLIFLEVDNDKVEKLMAYISKIKKMFVKDKLVHDCSIYTSRLNGIGVTFMTGLSKEELNYKLDRYCSSKLSQQNANTWIGFGDTLINRENFRFQSMFFSMENKID